MYSKKNWIQGAIKHPGALHRKLGVPENEKIPKSKIDAAIKQTKDPLLKKEAVLARTLEGFATKHKKTNKKKSPK